MNINLFHLKMIHFTYFKQKQFTENYHPENGNDHRSQQSTELGSPLSLPVAHSKLNWQKRTEKSEVEFHRIT